jgi:hypothetical protein
LSLVRKSEFAEMRGVSPGRVSQWIAAGQIDGAAIVGSGQRALINVELACAQLQERLAVDERFGLNGLSTNLDPKTPAPGEGGNAQAAKALPAPPVRVIPEGETEGTVEARLKAEKLKQAEFLTNKLELENASRKGQYMDAMEAAAGMARVADEMLKIFEGSFPEFASALAAKFQVPQREALLLLRDEFRRVRAQLAAVHGAEAAKTPKTVEVD